MADRPPAGHPRPVALALQFADSKVRRSARAVQVAASTRKTRHPAAIARLRSCARRRPAPPWTRLRPSSGQPAAPRSTPRTTSASGSTPSAAKFRRSSASTGTPRSDRSCQRNSQDGSTTAPGHDAAAEHRKGARFNPFDRESAELLRQVEYERRQRKRLATIDAPPLPPPTENAAARRRSAPCAICSASTATRSSRSSAREENSTAFRPPAVAARAFRGAEDADGVVPGRQPAGGSSSPASCSAARPQGLSPAATPRSRRWSPRFCPATSGSSSGTEGMDFYCSRRRSRSSAPPATHDPAALLAGLALRRGRLVSRGRARPNALALARLSAWAGDREKRRAWPEVASRSTGIWYALAGKLRA
jgi:hypothetical protein